MNPKRGFTLIELVVAVGLFALIMTLASGAYFIMINLNRQAQGVSTGINNLSFALETMTRDIRTGYNYSCSGSGNCGSGGSTFSFKNSGGDTITYAFSSLQSDCGASNIGCIIETVHRASLPLGYTGPSDITSRVTDPSVNISSLSFFVSGTARTDALQPYVTITIAGSIPTGGTKQQDFVVETGAAMRGTDI